jgi:hypothetical protein
MFGGVLRALEGKHFKHCTVNGLIQFENSLTESDLYNPLLAAEEAAEKSSGWPRNGGGTASSHPTANPSIARKKTIPEVFGQCWEESPGASLCGNECLLSSTRRSILFRSQGQIESLPSIY